MSCQIDQIISLTEKGWHPYIGNVDKSVYEDIDCPTPWFGKWLYNGNKTIEAACVGCERFCQTLSRFGFFPKPQHLKALYKGQYSTLKPVEMVKFFSLLRVNQAAFCLNVSLSRVYELIALGKLTATKDKPVRIKSEDVWRLMNDFDE